MDAFWGSFRLKPSANTTKVTYEMGVHHGFPIPDIVRRQIQKRHARGVVKHIKEVVESA